MDKEFGQATVEDVDTGIVIPLIPDSCLSLTIDTQDSLDDLNKYKDDLQKCLNEQAWLSEQLADSCMIPTEAAQKLIDSESHRVQDATDAQQQKLEDLIVFKGLNNESMLHFSTRLREVFDNYVTHRRNTGITLPQFPAGCTDTATVVEDLGKLVTDIANEETYD